MSLFGVLDRSTSSPVVSQIGCRSLLLFLCPALHTSKTAVPAQQQRSFHRRAPNRPSLPILHWSQQQMDNFFISALVRAGSCHKHAKHASLWTEASPFTSSHHKPRRKRVPGGEEQTRGFKTGRRSSGSTAPVEITREEFHGLMDIYESYGAYAEPEQLLDKPAENEDLGRFISSKREDAENYKHQPWSPRDEEQRHAVIELKGLLDDPDVSHDHVFSCYKKLSYPRIPYLSLPTIRRLLNFMSVVQRKDEISMIRYLSLMDDMKAAEIPMTSGEWSTAIAFAGRCFSRVTSAEVDSALYIWREMEKEAGVAATNVTMNILFDVAVKARKFVLADMIIQEMKARGLRFSRFFRVSEIYYHGLRGDGEAVRHAYKRLVNAGEIVDTVVLNCVLVSLIRANEPTAAEHLFARMKRMHYEKTARPLPPTHWQERRSLGRKLDRAGHFRNSHLQTTSPVAPDNHTFNILISHHATESGNIDRVFELLEEKASVWHLPPQQQTFVYLFKGFRFHGGVRYSSWTRGMLEKVYLSYLQCLKDDTAENGPVACDAREDGDKDRFRLDFRMVRIVLLAYARCAGSRRTLEVWEDLQHRWRPRPQEMDEVVALLRMVVPMEALERPRRAL